MFRQVDRILLTPRTLTSYPVIEFLTHFVLEGVVHTLNILCAA